MAGELAWLNGKPSDNVKFPFSDAKSTLDKSIKDKNFQKCGDDAVTLLRSLEPYRGGNADLRAIHDLDIYDKHIAIIPTGQRFHRGTIHVRMIPGQNSEVETGDVEKIDFLFPKESSLAGEHIIATLQRLVELVEDVLDAFMLLVRSRTT